MRIAAVASTQLFVSARELDPGRPRQIIPVQVASTGPGSLNNSGEPITVEVHGRGVITPEPVVLAGLAPGEVAAAGAAVDVAGSPARRNSAWPAGLLPFGWAARPQSRRCCGIRPARRSAARPS